MKTVLTIAGSDSSGGAGIQADIKTMTAHGVYAMSAITALTAQNTMGVSGIFDVPDVFLAQQLDAVFTDIYPDAVKVGMVSSGALVHTIADKLKEYKAKHVVVDPVMVATVGSKLMDEDAVSVLTARLFPLAEIITPNVPEAEVLTGGIIQSEEDMQRAAKELYESYGCAVLIKGGHLKSSADDLLYDGGFCWIRAERIDNPNTHGTGCTLSSAIASNLAMGQDIKKAVTQAKAYVTGAIRANLDLGHGRGPLWHGYAMHKEG